LAEKNGFFPQKHRYEIFGVCESCSKKV